MTTSQQDELDYLVAPERFEAEGFTLRGFRPGDGPLLSEAVNASYDHLAPWMAWAQRVQSEAESEKRVRCFRARTLLANDFVIGIFSPKEERLLGGTGFHLREGPLSARCAEVGMWIREGEAGRGLGTRALAAMLRWGFSEWPWLRLSWRSDADNVASIRCAEKAGMQREGVLRCQPADVGNGRRNTVCFAALRGEAPSLATPTLATPTLP